MRKTLLFLLFCLAITSCTDLSQQLLGSWRTVEHYEHDATKYPYIKYLEGITIYEFSPNNHFRERHYIEVLKGDTIIRTNDQLRYAGIWQLSGDTLVINKTIKELRPYYSDMDTTKTNETEIYYIQSLTRDSLITKMKFYRSYLDVRLERVEEK